MKGARVPATSISFVGSLSRNTVRRQHCSSPATVLSRPLLGFDIINGNSSSSSSRYWDKFYKRHQNKFFKDRHYLEKDRGQYFYHHITTSPNGKVVLEVGCGAGNTIFPLIATYPKLFVHACDFSPHAIALVKSHVGFNEDQVNAFVCDVANDDLCDRMMPSSIDVVTLIFMLSAVCPKKMPLILQNIKQVLKPNGYILLRDYAIGDYAQVELHKRNQMISENFYVRGDGTHCRYGYIQQTNSESFSEHNYVSAMDKSHFSASLIMGFLNDSWCFNGPGFHYTRKWDLMWSFEPHGTGEEEEEEEEEEVWTLGWRSNLKRPICVCECWIKH